MKMNLILGMSMLLLLAACGAQPDEPVALDALDILPDETLITLAIVNPEAAVEALDAYSAGVPLLGESMISGWLLTALDCADMQEVSSKYGIDTRGTVVFYMQSMMPQSIGMALPVADPATFWSVVGLQPTAGEPIGDQEVSSFDVDFGKIYVCSKGGLMLLAGSRAGLQGMLDRSDGEAPASLPGIPDGSIYGFASVSTFGPMAAQQIAMFRPQILAEMQDGGGDAEMTANLMNLYFDGIDILLTETESAEFVITFDPEYISGHTTMEFVEGSDMASVFAPGQVHDMTGMIPVGDVAVARVSFDPATSVILMNAVLDAMGIQDVPQEMVEFWAQCSANTAISVMSDADVPLNLVAVYEMPEGSDLQTVADMYQQQFQMIGSWMGEMPGLSLTPVEMVERDGMQWVTFGMNMDMTAMTEAIEPDTDEPMPVGLHDISWTAWLTAADGVLYLEMGPEPVIVPLIISGSWEGPTAASMPEMADISPDAEVALLLNLPAYMNMALGMSGLGLPTIDSEPVWMEISVDCQEGRTVHRCRVDGSDLAAFITQAVQTFSAMGMD